jgi:hypothetical protein
MAADPSSLQPMTTANPSLPPVLCTIQVGAQFIGRGMTFIYQALAEGKIRGVKSDKRTLLVVESLREYAASLPPAKITYPSQTKRRKAVAETS